MSGMAKVEKENEKTWKHKVNAWYELIQDREGWLILVSDLSEAKTIEMGAPTKLVKKNCSSSDIRTGGK